MATSYTGLRVQDTYNAIIKIGDNSNLTGTPKLLSDGLGNDSPLYLSGTRLGIGISPAYQFHTSGNAKIGGNLIVSGNLTVNGTLTYLNVQDLAVEDPIIKLAKDNTANTLDIGLFGKYVATGTKYKGFFNDASDDKFKLFIGTTVEPTTTVDTSASGYTVGTLVANLEGNVTGTVSSLSNHTTTNLAEGTNLYYTNARADARVNLQTGANLDLSSKDTDDLSEGTTNLYFTTARARASFTEGTGVTITDGEIAIGQDVATDSNVTFGNITGSAISGTTGTFSGQVTIPETPTADAHAASKKYVDDNLVPAQSLSNVLGVGNTSGANDIIMADDQKINFGTDSDLQIYHDDTDGYIKNEKGNLIIEQTTDDADIIFKSDNGSGATIEYFRLDGSTSTIPFGRSPHITDNVKLYFGNDTANDASIKWDSTASELFIDGESKFLDNLAVVGAIKDSSGDSGTSGQVLSSTGTGTNWIDLEADVAKRIDVTVKNVSGGSLAKGTVVHAAPTASPPSGNVIEVIAADANDAAKMPSIGVLNETIADQAEGEAVMFGAVSGIDTSSFSIGDELYVSETAGEFTATKPTAFASQVQKVAVVIKSHASNGLIKVFGAGRANDVPNRVDRNMNFTDDSILSLGTGQDLRIYHNSTISLIQNFTGNLEIRQAADDKDIIFYGDDMSGGITPYFRIDGSEGYTKIHREMRFLDDVQLSLGSSRDLEIYHDGTNSVINNRTGDLQIYNNADDKDIVFLSDNGSGDTIEYFRLDGGLATHDGTNTTQTITVFPDNSKIQLGSGTSGDLRLFHNGTNSFIANNTGNIEIINYSDDKDIIFKSDNGSGAVIEYFRLDGSTNTIPFGRSPHIVDNVRLYFGNDTANDASIKWDSTANQLFIDGSSKFLDGLDIVGDLSVTGNFKNDLIFERASTRKIIFNSDVNFASDLAFLYFNENSSFHRTGTENVRFSIGTFNDFSNSSTHSDALDLQGGARLYLNVGDWDTELDSAIGTPAVGSELDDYPIQFAVNNDVKVRINDSGHLYVDSGELVITPSTGYGRIEIGGASGGYIDLKAPASDNYDLRIITSQGGNEITTASGDLKINTANTLALTIDSSQNATFAGTIQSDDITIVDGTNDVNLYFANTSYGIQLDYSAGDMFFRTNGATRLTIANGGAATFAGSVDVNGSEITVGTNNSRFAENNLRFLSSGTAYIDHNTVGQSFVFRTSNASSLDTTALTIASNGNATFAGSVTANSFIKSGGTSSQYLMADGSVSTGGTGVDGSGTANDVAMWSDSDTLTDAPIAISGNNAAFAGNIAVTAGNKIQLSGAADGTHHFYHDATTDYDKVNYSTGFQFEHHSSGVHMTINSSGNFGINTTSPSAKLTIQGTNSANGGIKIQNSGGNPYAIYSDNNDLLFTNGNGSTTALTIAYSGNATFAGNVSLPDNKKAIFGSGSDLQIYHDAGNSLIEDTGTGNLYLRGSSQIRLQGINQSNMIIANESGSVLLYNNNASKLETTAYGVQIINLSNTTAASETADKIKIGSFGAGRPAIFFDTSNTTYTNRTWFIENIGAAGKLRFGRNGKDIMEIFNDGDIYMSDRLGIGNTSPDTKLSLYHATDDVSINVNTGTGGSYPKKTGISFGAISTSLGGDSKFKGGAGIQAINTAASNNPTNLAFWTTSGGSPAERMRIDTSGAVGIGTSSPTARLDILTNSATGDNSIDRHVRFRADNGEERFNFFVGRSGNSAYLNIHNSSEAITTKIHSSGASYFTGSSVGIGVTNPSFKTHFRGGSNTEETVLKLDKSSYSDTGGHTTILGFGNEPASWAKGGIGFERTGSYDRGKIHFLQENTSNTDTVTLSDSVMTIDSSGYLGIGLTNPAVKLEIQDSTHTTMKIRSGNNDNILFAQAIQSSDARIGTDTNTDLSFYTNASERMRIDSSGNLLVTKTSANNSTVGNQLMADGSVNSTVNGDTVARFNRLGTDGEIVRFQHDTSTDGAINSSSGRIAIGSSTTGIFFDSIRDVVAPHNMNTNTFSTNISLGRSLIPFKDLYLSGSSVFTNGAAYSSAASIRQQSNSLIFSGGSDGYYFNKSDNTATHIRINSSGQVGINVTNPNNALEVRATSDGTHAGIFTPNFINSSLGACGTTLLVQSQKAVALNLNRYYSFGTIQEFRQNNDLIGYFNVTSGALTLATAGARNLAFTTNGSERMHVTSSGAVGIGISNPSYDLHVVATIGTRVLKLGHGVGHARISTDDASKPLDLQINSQNALRVATNKNIGIGTDSPSYKLHVNGSAQVDGTLYTDRVAAGIPMPSHIVDAYSSTSGVFAGRFVYAGTSGSDCAILLRLAGGSTSPSYIDFIYGTAQTGSITTNGSSTFYLTSSDYRLKENVVELNGALDRLDNLKPKRFNFISDSETTVDGFLAHEVADVVPEAIHGEKDAVNEDGEIIAQGIDQSKLVPLLVAAVQELRAEVELLKSQINS